jgi:hypothetical protein
MHPTIFWFTEEQPCYLSGATAVLGFVLEKSFSPSFFSFIDRLYLWAILTTWAFADTVKKRFDLIGVSHDDLHIGSYFNQLQILLRKRFAGIPNFVSKADCLIALHKKTNTVLCRMWHKSVCGAILFALICCLCECMSSILAKTRHPMNYFFNQSQDTAFV